MRTIQVTQSVLMGSVVSVTRERQKDDEAEQHRESGRQHPEDACCAVAVGETAALGCGPAYQEHHRDRHGGHGDDDQGCPDDVHRANLSLAIGQIRL
jgi:hypothetical protein